MHRTFLGFYLKKTYIYLKSGSLANYIAYKFYTITNNLRYDL